MKPQTIRVIGPIFQLVDSILKILSTINGKKKLYCLGRAVPPDLHRYSSVSVGVHHPACSWTLPFKVPWWVKVNTLQVVFFVEKCLCYFRLPWPLFASALQVRWRRAGSLSWPVLLPVVVLLLHSRYVLTVVVVSCLAGEVLVAAEPHQGVRCEAQELRARRTQLQVGVLGVIMLLLLFAFFGGEWCEVCIHNVCSLLW